MTSREVHGFRIPLGHRENDLIGQKWGWKADERPGEESLGEMGGALIQPAGVQSEVRAGECQFGSPPDNGVCLASPIREHVDPG